MEYELRLILDSFADSLELLEARITRLENDLVRFLKSGEFDE